MSETRPRGAAPIEFWFDFASGYAYFAALEIEALALRHGRTVAWRPFTLGAAFKVTGVQGLSRTRSSATMHATTGSASPG
jgi:2-hydroxychromene-2-carboxylate isomerase